MQVVLRKLDEFEISGCEHVYIMRNKNVLFTG